MNNAFKMPMENVFGKIVPHPMHHPNREIVHATMKWLENEGVLLPNTNADVEYGKWYKEQELFQLSGTTEYPNGHVTHE